ncbi:MAG TPA: amidohydrolase family protein [Stellaceae bacterium]|nr:amidohydrolase family protein [Stellaceae bacterium]
MDRRQFFVGAAAAGASLAYGARRPWAQSARGAQPAKGGQRRKVTVGGKRVRTVDVHCHTAIPDVAPIVKGTSLERRAQRQLTVPGNNPTLENRIATMDAQGIDVEAISVNEWWYPADRDLARKICEVQNEKLMALCKQEPERLVAFATVPLQFPDLAAEMLEVAMKQQGLRGAGIGGNVAGVELSDPKFDPFWAKAEELDALLFMHPQDSEQATGIAKRVEGYGALGNVIGNPLETTIALSHLIMDGTLDKFPKLRICGAHAGGYLPSYAGRLDHGCSVQPASCKGPGPKKRPSDYLKQLYVDTMVFTPEGLRHLAVEIGPRHIMIGTDYGFPWVTDPVGHVLATPGLSDADKVAILGGTAAKLLRLS